MSGRLVFHFWIKKYGQGLIIAKLRAGGATYETWRVLKMSQQGLWR